MPKVSPIQTNFTAGEISQQLEGRVDIARYANAVQKLENFLIAPYGGVDRRAGSVFAARAKYSDKKCRLISFQFSTIQNYIIEMGDLYMRFYRDDAAITEADKVITNITQANPAVVSSAAHGYANGDTVIINDVVGMTEVNNKRYLVANVAAGTFELQDLDANNIDSTGFTAYGSAGRANRIYEIVTPYLEADLFEIQFAQSADIMWLAHQNYAPRKLSRLGDTSWTLALEVFIGGPFQPDNITATTVTPSAINGAITVTASTPIFNADMVGSFFKIGGTVGVSPDDIQGYVLITAFTSTTQISATVQETLDGVGATDLWAYGSFSDDAGYPSCVAFHEQRLWYGGTIFEPQTVFASQILIFNDLTVGSLDDDALQYEIATEQVNAIRFISSGRGLAIGTLGGGFIVSSGQDFIPLTPSNVSIRRDTTFGGELIIPRRIGNFLYYVQRGSRKIREFAYNFDIDSHRSLDMTLLAEHITEGGITSMAYQQSPNSILWCVRGDGEMACLTRQIDQEVIGWSRIIAGETVYGASSFESVSTIPAGEYDEVWVVVNRVVDGTTRRFIEYMSAPTFTSQDDAFFVDSGLTLDNPIAITAATKADPVVVTAALHGFSNGDTVRITDVLGMTELNNKLYHVANVGANTFELQTIKDVDVDGTAFTTYKSGGNVALAVTTISGLDHLEGESVAVLADGSVRPNKTVTDGIITLDIAAAKVHAGLGYTSEAETLRLEAGSATGTAQGKTARIYEVTARFYKTLGGEMGIRGTTDIIQNRTSLMPMNQPPSIFTEDKRMQFPKGYDRQARVYIKQDQPLPMTILAIMPKMDVFD